MLQEIMSFAATPLGSLNYLNLKLSFLITKTVIFRGIMKAGFARV